jgi:hypothetical protein
MTSRRRRPRWPSRKEESGEAPQQELIVTHVTPRGGVASHAPESGEYVACLARLSDPRAERHRRR